MKRIILIFTCFIIPLISFSQSNSCACCSEYHDDFDFWIGDWVVTNVDGSAAGTNSIKKIQGNCVLQENWTSAALQYTGTSTNFYNANSKQWEQLWLDNQGGVLHLKGRREENKMILKSDTLVNAEGQNFYHQITWTKNEDGTVRQLWETFIQGEPVSVVFDGMYNKQN